MTFAQKNLLIKAFLAGAVVLALCMNVTAAVTETADAYAVRIEVQGKGIPPVLWHQRNWPDLATCEEFLGSAEFQIEFLKLAMAIIETDDDADLLAPPSCQLIGLPS